MSFLAPFWLLLLIPWLLLATWMWRRERRVVAVSTNRFWPSGAVLSHRDKQRSRPPTWVLAALVSLLAAIAALADPIVGPRRARLTVIVDPHVSMSATRAGRSVAREMASRLQSDLEAIAIPVDMDFILPGESPSISQLGSIDTIRWTAISTTPLVEQRCRDSIHRGEATVVLSSQALEIPPGAIRYAPASQPSNRAIEEIAGSVEPRPQLMVGVSHEENAPALNVVVHTGTQTIRQLLEPDATSLHTTAFVDIPEATIGPVEARIEGTDDFRWDDHAYLTRSGSWPLIEIVGAVPDAVRRFAAIYSRQRPAGAGAVPIAFTAAEQEDRPGVLFAPTESLSAAQAVSLDLPWRAVNGMDRVMINRIAKASPAGFDVLQRLRDRPVLAVRRSPSRQVWIGCDFDEFAQSPQWVAWMSAIVDFLNEAGAPRWTQYAPEEISEAWKAMSVDPTLDASPGIYERPDGVQAAVNLAAMRWARPNEDTSGKLSEAVRAAAQSVGTRASASLAAAALFLALLAGVLISRSPRLDGRGGAT